MKRVVVFDEIRRYVAGIDLAGATDHYVCGPSKDDGSHDVEHFGTTPPELQRMLQWLQRQHSCGLLRSCFRPPEKYNAVRSVIRERENVVAFRTQSIQGMQKSCDQMNIRIHHAVSDIDGVTGMRILEAIVNGERDPRKLAKMRDPRCKKTEAQKNSVSLNLRVKL